MIKLIVALGPKNLLGKDDKMAWNIPKELSFFRDQTFNCWILMGRKTFDNLPNKLPNRKVCVAGRQKTKGADKQVFSVPEIENFINNFKNSEEILWIAGGKWIYENFYHYAEEIYVSRIVTKAEGNVYLHWDLSRYQKKLILVDEQFSVYKYMKE